MLDAHLNNALEDRYCVFGHKLFECDEERRLDRDATAYRGQTGTRGISRHSAGGGAFIIVGEKGVPSEGTTLDSVPDEIHEHGHRIGNQ